MKNLEIIIIALTVTALVLNVFFVPYTETAIVFLLSLLSTFYFMGLFELPETFGFFDALKALFKEDYFKDVFTIYRASGISLSILITGILFKSMYWPFGSVLTIIGLFLVSVLAVIMAIKGKKESPNLRTLIYMRIVIIGTTGIVFSVLSHSIHEFKHREYPTYIEALNRAMNDPQNDSLWIEVDEERQKMNDK